MHRKIVGWPAASKEASRIVPDLAGCVGTEERTPPSDRSASRLPADIDAFASRSRLLLGASAGIR
jgi:hypothetical protein